MSKKDVLGASVAAEIIQKMKSMPHIGKSRFCAKGGIYFS